MQATSANSDRPFPHPLPMTKAALARLHRAWNALEERGSVDAEGRDADLQSVTAILDASRRQLIRDALDAAVVMVPDGSAMTVAWPPIRSSRRATVSRWRASSRPTRPWAWR